MQVVVAASTGCGEGTAIAKKTATPATPVASVARDLFFTSARTLPG
jgi:hypothetical protein